jgi:hypothetical protein
MGLTKEQKEHIAELWRENLSPAEITLKLGAGATVGQVNGYIYRECGAGRLLRRSETRDDPDFETVREKRERKDYVDTLSKQLKEAAREETAVQRIVAALEKYTPQVPPPKPPKPAKPAKTASKETLVIDLADWHYGEQVDRERMRGLNEYNSTIAAKRVSHVVQTIGDIKARLERGGGWHFEDAVVVLGGDMVTGWIHDLERNSDDTIILSCLNCADLIFHALQDMSQMFPAVHVTGVVGNHGRLGKRKEYKDPERNFDYLVYRAVAWRMAQFKNTSFAFPAAHSFVLNIRGHNIFVTHGDEYRAQFSLPYYGIDRASRGVQAIESSRGKPIDYFFIHHWHSEAATPLAGGHKNIVMPSLKGGDEYALEKLGVCSPAGQWMAGFNEDQGITMEWRIKCQLV